MSMFEGFKFRSASSLIHRIDPRAKFYYVCVLFVAAILFNQLIPLLILLIIQIPFVFIARVEKEWVRSLKGSAKFAVIIFAMNLFSRYFFPSEPIYLPSIIEWAVTLTVRFVVLVESFE